MPEVDLEFAEFSPSHADELVAMWRASFEHGVGIRDPHPIEEQRAYLFRELVPNYHIRLALLEGRIVGFVAASSDRVAQLYVHPGHLRRGIGSTLLEWAQQQSDGHLSLYTFERNKNAQRFYEGHGFTIAARGFEEFWQLEDIRYEWTSSCEQSQNLPIID